MKLKSDDIEPSAITINDLLNRLRKASDNDLYTILNEISSGKILCAPELILAILQSRQLTTMEITKTLSAGANTTTTQFPPDMPVKVYFISVLNPDLADRVFNVSVRDEGDALRAKLGTRFWDDTGQLLQADSKYTVLAGGYLTFHFPGGLILPKNYELYFEYAAMTGSNDSLIMVVFERLIGGGGLGL